MDVHAQSPSGERSSSELPQIPGGRYHIVERLSTGAIGAVYKALDTILDRPVAVKCVHLDTPFADQGPDELRERFVREARIAARLQHPNIVTIHDIVATNDRGFIIMEFIEGQSLESLLSGKNRLALPESIRVISQLASALDYAHGHQVVHRDVKPANILVSPSLWVWVTDFGIAKSELSTNLTMAGGVLGTPDYMSPEQAKGEDVDARSDLFSLGCILFECVTGEKPFRSPSLTGVLLSIINDEPVFPLNWTSLGLPNRLKPILHHALEKERNDRYPTGDELVLALTQLAAAGTESPKESPAPPATVAEASAAPSETAEKLEEEEKVGEASEEPSREAAPAEPLEEQAASDPEPAASASPEPAAEVPADPTPASLLEESTAEARSPEPPAEASSEVPQTEEAAPAEAPEEIQSPESPVESFVETSTPAASAEPSPEEAPVETRPEPSAETSSSETVREDISPERTVVFDAQSAPPTPPAPAIHPERVKELRDESRPLRLSPNLSAELQRAEISPEEGFLLSRIDGLSRASDILSMSPMSEDETAAALLNLLDKGLILFGGKSPSREPPATAPGASTPPQGSPSEATRKELERLLALAKSQCYAELLGIEVGAPASSRKSAYLKIISTYHPDKFPKAPDEIREKLSRLCAEASEALDQLANAPAPPPPSASPVPTPASSRPTPSYGTGGYANDNGAAFDKRRYARELYDRAFRAFETQDFWESIQLCRQAVEVDDAQAEYFHLLGRALMQNKKWRKEAADSFRRASDLDPGNLEYLGMLGAIYRLEGLQARANAILKKAQVLDPEYALPEIDGQMSVQAE